MFLTISSHQSLTICLKRMPFSTSIKHKCISSVYAARACDSQDKLTCWAGNAILQWQDRRKKESAAQVQFLVHSRTTQALNLSLGLRLAMWQASKKSTNYILPMGQLPTVKNIWCSKIPFKSILDITKQKQTNKHKIDAFTHKVMLKKYGVSKSWVWIQVLPLSSWAPITK